MQIGKTELLDDNFQRRISALEDWARSCGMSFPGGGLPMFVTYPQSAAFNASEVRWDESMEAQRNQAEDRARRLEAALRTIIERADNGVPGTSKVQDMKRIAEDALGETSTRP